MTDLPAWHAQAAMVLVNDYERRKTSDCGGTARNGAGACAMPPTDSSMSGPALYDAGIQVET